MNIPTYLKPSQSSHLPAYEDGTERECSETSTYKIQTPGNYQEESIKHSENGESLKSRRFWEYLIWNLLPQDLKMSHWICDYVRLFCDVFL